jgi:sigma-E factor negative regulatory protein RseC
MSQSPVDRIQHDGIIKQINADSIYVSIVSMATCASCQVKGACSASDMQEKIVEVKKEEGRSYEIGHKVTITIDQSVGTWAVLLGYVFPLILVVTSLIILTSIMVDQGSAGLISIGLLIPYYSILYFTRKFTANKFEFKLM